MRTLLCIIGLVENPELIWPNLKKHVIDVLDADVCLAGPTGHAPSEIDLKYKFEYDETKGDLHDAYDFMRKCENGSEWRDLKVIKDNWIGPLGEECVGTGGITVFYRWFLWKSLHDRDLIDEYDQFIITRGDYLHVADIMKPVKDTILIPGYEFHGGVCDRFAIVPREYLAKFLRLGTDIVNKPEELMNLYKERRRWPFVNVMNGWNGETFLFIMLMRTRLWEHISFYKPTMFTARSIPPAARFCHTTYSDVYKCYLKYTNEYRLVVDNIKTGTCNFIHPVSAVDWGYTDPESGCMCGRI